MAKKKPAIQLDAQEKEIFKILVEQYGKELSAMDEIIFQSMAGLLLNYFVNRKAISTQEYYRGTTSLKQFIPLAEKYKLFSVVKDGADPLGSFLQQAQKAANAN